MVNIRLPASWICGGGDARPVCFTREPGDGIKIIGRVCADWHSRHPCSGGPEIPPLKAE